jgi:hypothetical protein
VKRVIAIIMLLFLVATPILAVMPFGEPVPDSSNLGVQEECVILTNDPDVDNEIYVSTVGNDQ